MIGTVKYFIHFIQSAIIVNIVYLGIAALLTLLDMQALPCYGYWTMLMVDLVIDCNRDPDRPMSCCSLPFQFKAKYFPWIFFIIFGIIMGHTGIVAGFLVGYINVFGWLSCL